MLRVPTRLDDATEALIHRAIGCCIAVHRDLGPGLLEEIYSRAVGVELQHCGIPFEREKRYPVFYRGQRLYVHRLDLVVDNKIMLEFKAVDRLAAVHVAQALSGLRISKLGMCLLVNFNVAVLPEGIKRVVL
jgi:GxxExxY protein